MSRNSAFAARPNRAMKPARPLRTTSSGSGSPPPGSMRVLGSAAPSSRQNRQATRPAVTVTAPRTTVSTPIQTVRDTPSTSGPADTGEQPISSSPQPTSRWALQATTPPSTANHSSRGAARRRSSTLLVTSPPSQVGPDVERQHDDHPHRVDEVPVHGRGLHVQVASLVEVAEPGPDLHEQDQQQADRHVHAVEAGDGEEQRPVGVGRRGELLQLGHVLIALESQEGRPEHERGGQPQAQPADMPGPDAPVGEDHGHATGQQDDAHHQRQGQLRGLDGAQRPVRGRLESEVEVAGDEGGEQGRLGGDEHDHAPPAGRAAGRDLGGDLLGGHRASSCLRGQAQAASPARTTGTPRAATTYQPASRPPKPSRKPTATTSGTTVSSGISIARSGSASSSLVRSTSWSPASWRSSLAWAASR